MYPANVIVVLVGAPGGALFVPSCMIRSFPWGMIHRFHGALATCPLERLAIAKVVIVAGLALARGHAATAPPNSVMNSRRFTRLPHRRGRAEGRGGLEIDYQLQLRGLRLKQKPKNEFRTFDFANRERFSFRPPSRRRRPLISVRLLFGRS